VAVIVFEGPHESPNNPSEWVMYASWKDAEGVQRRQGCIWLKKPSEAEILRVQKSFRRTASDRSFTGCGYHQDAFETVEAADRDIDFYVMMMSGGEPPEDAKDSNGEWEIIDAEGEHVGTINGTFSLETARFIVGAINAEYARIKEENE
jgi:hypothetical protein